jgi:hypothetical protein
MIKTKYRQTKPATPGVVVFGLNASGKPKAAYFPEKHASLARTAARKLGLSVFRLTSRDAVDLAGKLPTGKVYANGRAFVSYVRRELYEKLTTLARRAGASRQALRVCSAAKASPAVRSSSAKPLSGQKATSAAAANPLPNSWPAIDVGHLVIAQAADPGDGWWEAIVVGKDEDMLTLQWRDYPKEPKLVRHRAAVALLRPIPDQPSTA